MVVAEIPQLLLNFHAFPGLLVHSLVSDPIRMRTRFVSLIRKDTLDTTLFVPAQQCSDVEDVVFQ